jgi:predicted RNA-binding protein YlqC (UPF0109 family)
VLARAESCRSSDDLVGRVFGHKGRIANSD